MPNCSQLDRELLVHFVNQYPTVPGQFAGKAPGSEITLKSFHRITLVAILAIIAVTFAPDFAHARPAKLLDALLSSGGGGSSTTIQATGTLEVPSPQMGAPRLW